MFIDYAMMRIDAVLNFLGQLSLYEVLLNGYDLNLPMNAIILVLLSTCAKYISMTKAEIIDGDREKLWEKADGRSFKSLIADPEPAAPASPLFFQAHKKYQSLSFETLGPIRELQRIRGLSSFCIRRDVGLTALHS